MGEGLCVASDSREEILDTQTIAPTSSDRSFAMNGFQADQIRIDLTEQDFGDLSTGGWLNGRVESSVTASSVGTVLL